MARRQRNFKKQTILDAIKDSHGIMSTIAKKLGCEWHTAERNVKRFPDTIMALKDEKEKLLDIAESQAIAAIQNGSEPMIRYYLSTIGKKRGYTESPNVVDEKDDSNEPRMLVRRNSNDKN